MHSSALDRLVERTEDELTTRQIAWGDFLVLLEKAAAAQWAPDATRKVRAALSEWEFRCLMYEYRLRDWEMAYRSGHAPLYRSAPHRAGPARPISVLCNGNYLRLFMAGQLAQRGRQ